MQVPTLTIKTWTGADGEYFTYEDMNRVESNANTLAQAIADEQTSSVNGTATIAQQTYLQTTRASQFRYDEANKLEAHLQSICRIVGASYSPELAWGTNRTLSYVDFNRWEQGLQAAVTAAAGYWPNGYLTINVTDIYGTMAAGRTVTIKLNGATVTTLQTNAEGVASCKLAIGTYTVSLDTPSSYQTVADQTAQVTSNATTTVVFNLVKQVVVTFSGYSLGSAKYTVINTSTSATVASGSSWSSTMSVTLQANQPYRLTITAYGDSQSYDFTTGLSDATHSITALFARITATCGVSIRSVRYNGYSISGSGTSVSWYVLKSNSSRTIAASPSTSSGSASYSGVSTEKAYSWTRTVSSASTVPSTNRTVSLSYTDDIDSNEVVIATSGTLTVPTAGTYRIFSIGGGGGGGGQVSSGFFQTSRGGGGGAGRIVEGEYQLSATGYAVQIGSGGAGGTSGNSGTGGTGGTTSFGTIISATGGSGGDGGIGGSGSSGGGAGTGNDAAPGSGDGVYGGDGGNGSVGEDSPRGTAGGSALTSPDGNLNATSGGGGGYSGAGGNGLLGYRTSHEPGGTASTQYYFYVTSSPSCGHGYGAGGGGRYSTSSGTSWLSVGNSGGGGGGGGYGEELLGGNGSDSSGGRGAPGCVAIKFVSF